MTNVTAPSVRRLRTSRLRALRPVPLLWLTVVWMALWGDFSVANALIGLAVAAAVTLAFPLPALPAGIRVHALHVVWLVVRFLYDVVIASVQVSVLTLRFGRQPRSAVVAVRLRTSSDLVMTMVSQMTSLVPGTIVVEARRQAQTVYVHALDIGDADGDQIRSQVLAQERRIALALGVEPGDELGDDGGNA